MVFCRHTLHSIENGLNLPIFPMIPNKICSFATCCSTNTKDSCKNSEMWVKQLPQVCPCLGNYLIISLNISLSTYLSASHPQNCLWAVGFFSLCPWHNQLCWEILSLLNLHVLQEFTVLGTHLLPKFAFGSTEACR